MILRYWYNRKKLFRICCCRSCRISLPLLILVRISIIAYSRITRHMKLSINPPSSISKQRIPARELAYPGCWRVSSLDLQTRSSHNESRDALQLEEAAAPVSLNRICRKYSPTQYIRNELQTIEERL